MDPTWKYPIMNEKHVFYPKILVAKKALLLKHFSFVYLGIQAHNYLNRSNCPYQGKNSPNILLSLNIPQAL